MCDGVLIRLPNGGEFCVPIYYELPKWWRIPLPDPAPDWLTDFSLLKVIGELSSRISNEKTRARLGEAISAGVAGVAVALPGNVTLPERALGDAARR